MQTNPDPTHLPSEQVALASPLSFTGSLDRIRRAIPATSTARTAAQALAVLAAWTVITSWYLMVALLLPLVAMFRLGRRSQRVAKRDQLRHRELVEARR